MPVYTPVPTLQPHKWGFGELAGLRAGVLERCSPVPQLSGLGASQQPSSLEAQHPAWPSGPGDMWGGGQVTAGLACPVHTRGQQQTGSAGCVRSLGAWRGSNPLNLPHQGGFAAGEPLLFKGRLNKPPLQTECKRAAGRGPFKPVGPAAACHSGSKLIKSFHKFGRAGCR